MLRGEYERMYRLEERYWWFRARRELVHALLRKHAPAAKRVVDIGCGTGITLASLDDAGVGVDASPEALAFSRKRGLHKLAAGSGDKLPLKDRSADVFLSLDVFEHMAHDEDAMSECLRILRPGGVGVISVPALMLLWSEHDVALMHHRRYSAAELREKLERAGFRVVRLTYAVSLLFPGVVAARLLGRLRRKREVRATLPELPAPFNALLLALMRLENRILKRASLPAGVSLVCVVEKPRA